MQRTSDLLERPGGPMLPVPYRVAARIEEGPDTVTLEMMPVEGEPLRFAPGQFNMLYAFGVGEVPISVSGDPAVAAPLVHTIRDVGAVSHALCEARPGDVLGVRGPFGTGWDVESAEGGDVLIVAGGIGLAPLRPAVYRLFAGRERFRRASLLVGARSPDLLLYHEELSSWRSRFDIDVAITVDHASPGWAGPVGVVGDLIPRAIFEPERTVALVCGPEVMIRFTANALLDAGIPASRVRVSLERNMKCGIAQCGHCQLGQLLVCRDGPVVAYDGVRDVMAVREL